MGLNTSRLKPVQSREQWFQTQQSGKWNVWRSSLSLVSPRIFFHTEEMRVKLSKVTLPAHQQEDPGGMQQQWCQQTFKTIFKAEMCFTILYIYICILINLSKPTSISHQVIIIETWVCRNQNTQAQKLTLDFSLPWSVTQLAFLEDRVILKILDKILKFWELYWVLLLGTWFGVLDPPRIQDSVAGLQISLSCRKDQYPVKQRRGTYRWERVRNNRDFGQHRSASHLGTAAATCKGFMCMGW